MAKEEYKTGKSLTQESLDNFQESLQDDGTVKIQGKCCNCKQGFPYGPEFLVDLLCQKCASFLPKQMTRAIEDRVAKRTLNLIRSLVNTTNFEKADLGSLRDVLNALLDLGDSQMPSIESIIKNEIIAKKEVVK